MSKNHVTEGVVSPTDVISIIATIGSILGGIASMIKKAGKTYRIHKGKELKDNEYQSWR